MLSISLNINANNCSYDNSDKFLLFRLLYSFIKSLTQTVGFELLKFKPQPILQMLIVVFRVELMMRPPIFVVPFAYISFGHFNFISSSCKDKKLDILLLSVRNLRIRWNEETQDSKNDYAKGIECSQNV